MSYDPIVVGGRRRADRSALPPISLLIPAAIVVLISLADVAIAQMTSPGGWGLVVVASAIPVAAFALAGPRTWRWHLAAVWFAVGLYLAAAIAHSIFLLTA